MFQISFGCTFYGNNTVDITIRLPSIKVMTSFLIETSELMRERFPVAVFGADKCEMENQSSSEAEL